MLMGFLLAYPINRIPIKFHRAPNYSNKAPTNVIRFLSILGFLFMLMAFVLLLIEVSFV